MPRRIEAVIKAKGALPSIEYIYSKWTYFPEGQQFTKNVFVLVLWSILISWDSELLGFCSMWAKIITIKRNKDLNYFRLCALNWFNTRVSQFELNYWNKWTFPQHSNLFRCTCICVCTTTHTYKYTLNKIINATLLFCPYFSWTELKDLRLFLCTQKAYYSNIVHKSV